MIAFDYEELKVIQEALVIREHDAENVLMNLRRKGNRQLIISYENRLTNIQTAIEKTKRASLATTSKAD